MRRVERCFLALGVVLLCCGSLIAAQRPDFSGDWQIDLEASDGVAGEIARRSQDSLRENTRDDIVDLQAQGEAFGGERTSNRQPRNDDRLGGAAGRLVLIPLLEYSRLGAMDRLTIDHGELELRMRDSEGETQIFFMDGRRIETEESGVSAVTKWKGSRLVAKTTLANKSTIRRQWKILDDGRLELNTRISPFVYPRPGALPGVPPLAVKAVYDRVEGDL